MSPWRPLPGRDPEQIPRVVGESLAGLARRLGAPAPSLLTAVFNRWEEVVGPAVAAHARPVSLNRGVLVIGADQPAWASQLRYLGADLLARLSALSKEGEIERVEIKVIPPKGR
jgi:predicted nucleic acid-binding Zn ribbon protein